MPSATFWTSLGHRYIFIPLPVRAFSFIAHKVQLFSIPTALYMLVYVCSLIGIEFRYSLLLLHTINNTTAVYDYC